MSHFERRGEHHIAFLNGNPGCCVILSHVRLLLLFFFYLRYPLQEDVRLPAEVNEHLLAFSKSKS